MFKIIDSGYVLTRNEKRYVGQLLEAVVQHMENREELFSDFLQAYLDERNIKVCGMDMEKIERVSMGVLTSSIGFDEAVDKILDIIYKRDRLFVVVRHGDPNAD